MGTSNSTLTHHRPPATRHRPDGETNLWQRLNIEWAQLCTQPSANAEAITWTASQPALTGLTSLADLEKLHRRDRDSVLFALLDLHQQGSRLAGRALLQLMLGKLITIARYARVTGHDRTDAFDERAAATVAVFMSIVSTHRPTGTNVYAALYFRVLGVISTAKTYANETAATWFLDDLDTGLRHTKHAILHPPDDESDISATEVLDWAVTRAIITTADRTLLQRAYLEQTDLDLAAVAAEVGLTHAALRKRLSRALARIRHHLAVTDRLSATPPRNARKRATPLPTAAR